MINLWNSVGNFTIVCCSFSKNKLQTNWFIIRKNVHFLKWRYFLENILKWLKKKKLISIGITFKQVELQCLWNYPNVRFWFVSTVEFLLANDPGTLLNRVGRPHWRRYWQTPRLESRRRRDVRATNGPSIAAQSLRGWEDAVSPRSETRPPSTDWPIRGIMPTSRIEYDNTSSSNGKPGNK